MMTSTEAYDPAMKMTDQAEADAWFEVIVRECMKENLDMPRLEAERIQRMNLAYFAGYYDNETRERVERLFKCEHPIFGKIAEKGPPTPEQAFKAGVEAGKRMKEKGLI